MAFTSDCARASKNQSSSLDHGCQAGSSVRRASPSSAILSAVVFNALIIVFLIPLALKGVAYRAVGAAALLRRNLTLYGLGGVIVPFIGIKAIDVVLSAIGFA